MARRATNCVCTIPTKKASHHSSQAIFSAILFGFLSLLSFAQSNEIDPTSPTATTSHTPKDPQLNDFSQLLTNSPFEVEIKAVEEPKKPDPPIFLSLKGVVQLREGWMATVINRKEPKKNIILRQGIEKGGLTLVRVDQNQSDYKETQAIIKENGKTLSVGYNVADIKKSLAFNAKPTAVRPTANNQAALQRALLQQQAAQKAKTPTSTPSSKTTPSRPRIRRVPTPPSSK